MVPEPTRERCLNQITVHLDSGRASGGKSSGTIDRVPSKWRRVNENSFCPQMKRIGPFKFRTDSNSQVQAMGEHKTQFLIGFLERNLKPWRGDKDTSKTNEGEGVSDDHKGQEDDDGGQIAENMRLDDLVNDLWEMEVKTKDCYSEEFRSIDKANFVEMMVVDGYFVVELLRLHYHVFVSKTPNVAKVADPILTNPRILTTLGCDLALFENQLPLFLLEKLYKMINKKNNIDHQQDVSLEVLAVTFFNRLLPQRNATSKVGTQKDKAHLLEVFHSTFLQSVSERNGKNGNNGVKSGSNPNGSIGVLHFASELDEAGVQFKKRKGDDLLDIKFGHGTLWVPPLHINDHTISLLLNFVAYEMSVEHTNTQPVFTNYLMFWNSLVNGPKDIEILHKLGIINNALGSNEDVADLLIRCREVIYDRNLGYLCNVIKELNDYCDRYNESKYRIWWRSLIRERFSSPWTCLSLFAAIFLLLLSALQTIYTMFPYQRH